MNSIKQARLTKGLNSRPGLRVGDCVPFYFCPRSAMLYVIHQANNPELDYKGGQSPIIHLQADLRQAVGWANSNSQRWAFTSSNAGSYYFDDYSDLNRLDKVNWDAVQANWWSGPGIDPSLKEGKQAEFLMEHSFPWELVSLVGVRSSYIRGKVLETVASVKARPDVEIKPAWYY